MSFKTRRDRFLHPGKFGEAFQAPLPTTTQILGQHLNWASHQHPVTFSLSQASSIHPTCSCSVSTWPFCLPCAFPKVAYSAAFYLCTLIFWGQVFCLNCQILVPIVANYAIRYLTKMTIN